MTFLLMSSMACLTTARWMIIAKWRPSLKIVEWFGLEVERPSKLTQKFRSHLSLRVSFSFSPSTPLPPPPRLMRSCEVSDRRDSSESLPSWVIWNDAKDGWWMISPISESAERERTTSDAERIRLEDVRRMKERKEMSGMENSSIREKYVRHFLGIH